MQLRLVMRFSCNSKEYWFVTIVLVYLVSSCTNKLKPTFESFSEWKQANPVVSQEPCNRFEQRVSLTSNTLSIDGIAKSMNGDIDDIDAQLEWNNEELIWLTGAQVSVRSSNNIVADSDEFLCHSLVNLHRDNQLPWKILTKGTDKRLFTFSQGVSQVRFPKGFGIPLLANTKLNLGNQVLNLTKPTLKSEVEFQIDIDFMKGDGNCDALKALYQQPVFVTKRTGGPVGAYNAGDSVLNISMANKTVHYDTNFAHCGISYENGYNPYEDQYGRIFTGHWMVSEDSLEVIATNVTPMLDLKTDTRIHGISMHVHPHAYSLELMDKTTNKSLFKGMVYYDKGNLNRIISLDYYTSEQGIAVFEDHEYQLVSTYLNPAGAKDITAMATLFLYMAE